MSGDISTIQEQITRSDQGSFVVPESFFVSASKEDIQLAWRMVETLAKENPSYEFWMETSTGFETKTIISWRRVARGNGMDAD